MAVMTRKEECRQYIRNIWSPNLTYKDLEGISLDLGVSLDYVKDLFKEMKLPYLSKNDMARMNREKYLLNTWSKQPRETRFTVDKLAEILHCAHTTVHDDIKRLGLEDYMLTNSELASRNNQEKRQQERENNFSVLNAAYEEYKNQGTQYTYEELALKGNLQLKFVRMEVKNLGYEAMIRPYVETCTKNQRMQYYRESKNFLRKNANLLRLSVKFGMPVSKVKYELMEAGVFRTYRQSIDDCSDASRFSYNEPSTMSYEDLNRALGVSKGTYYADRWGSFDNY